MGPNPAKMYVYIVFNETTQSIRLGMCISLCKIWTSGSSICRISIQRHIWEEDIPGNVVLYSDDSFP